MNAGPMVASLPPQPWSADEFRLPSRLASAFWLAILVELLLLVAAGWILAHRYVARTTPLVEQVQLVQVPKPVQTPKQQVRPHPKPKPKAIKRHVARRPVKPLMPPPIPKPAVPLPPSPVAAPVPPPSPPKVQVPPPLPTPGEKASYLGSVRDAIQNAVQFPSGARLLRQQGGVQVEFDLRDGVVSHLLIVRPGMLKSFNDNALSAVRDARIPLPPKELAHRTINLVLWVKFSLRNN